MSPSVSIIIPTHNRADLLKRAIQSVLAQTYRNFELIVVSDGSTDNTDEIVASFDDPRLVFLKHAQPRGASAARNTGIQASRGDYIAFLDDDDEWLPEKLEKQVQYIRNLPECVGMVYCWMDYYQGKEVVSEHHPQLRGNIFEHVLDGQPIGGAPTLLVRRTVVEKLGGFDESLPRGNDGDFIRRVCLEYEVDFVPEVLVKVHIDHGYDQITRFDETGIRNAIRGQKAKFTKFKEELRRYPKQAANIYSSIAYHYSQLDDWRSSIVFYRRAFNASFFSVKVYVNLLLSLKGKIAK